MFEGLGLAVTILLSSEIDCLAQNIYFEARNQSYAGQIAISHVVLNRMNSSKYPDTACGVIKQSKLNKAGKPIKHKCQFSWYCDGVSDIPKNKKAWNAAVKAANESALLWENGFDMSGGSTHYHSKDVSPKWAKKLNYVVRIDDHLFYKD
jgi:N-acetylmuramoyl-L-alanine amidase